MDCNTCEKILMTGITDDAKLHLESCVSCKLYYSLLEHKPMTLKDKYIEPSAVNRILAEADKSKRRHDLISLVAFIFSAIAILSVVVYFVVGNHVEVLKYYLGFLSAFMPISLPILSRLKRKAVL